MKSSLRTPTPNLDDSVAFYERLGFTRLSAASREGCVALADAALVVEVDPDRKARTAITFHGEEALALREALAANGPVVEHAGRLFGCDPSGAFVMLTPDAAAPSPEGGAPASALGRFQGLSLESLDPEGSVRFWEALGYAPAAGAVDQGWISLTREGCLGVTVMGLHACPHLFFNPGLTYFNSGKNLEVIAEIRAAGVPITEEITCFNDEGVVDNVVLRDPGGTGFFVFND